MQEQIVEENTGSVPRASQSVQQIYQERLDSLRSQIAVLQRTRKTAKFAMVVLAAALGGVLVQGWPSPSFVTVALLGTATGYAFQRYGDARRRSLDLARRGGFYERGLDRLDGQWTALPETGLQYAREGHLFQQDLQVIGVRSLFTLLSTTRSEVGASRLAGYLLDSVRLEESEARQAAVRELKPQNTLREEMAVLGKYAFQRGDVQTLRQWMAHPVLHAARWRVAALLLLALGMAVPCFLALIGVVTWPYALLVMLPLLGVELLLTWPLRREVRARSEDGLHLADELTVLREGLALLQRQTTATPKLTLLLGAVQARDAGRRVAELQRLARTLEQSRKEWFFAFAFLTAAETQLVLAMERWRARYGELLHGWVDAWAEFEALSALAGYAFENPGDVFPDLDPDKVTFCGNDFKHPLLSAGKCVGNDIRFDEEQRFYIVSGSNMAGKSTLLRTVGLNAVLALAGGPVRASAARIGRLQIAASITTTDSLLDGQSRFLAEAERLRGMVRLAETGPVLFLVDEIFSGTNSQDRRVAADGLLEALMKRGAIGALSTHDLALTEIPARGELRGVNVYMESSHADDPLRFDYRMKPGVAMRSNALAILRMIGVL